MSNSLTKEAATVAAELLRVFGQPQRLMILTTLIGRELAVGAIEVETGIGQPGLSQQLAELRRAGLVNQRRAAKTVLYQLADERTKTIVQFVSSVFGHQAEPVEAIRSLRPAAPVSAGEPAAAMFAVIDPERR